MSNIQNSNYDAIRQEVLSRAEKMPLLKSSRLIISGTKDLNESIAIEFTTEDICSVDEFREKYRHNKIIFIVTTIFNDVSFYRKTLESIWNQEEPGLRVVYLIKDASTNTDCIDLLKEFIKTNNPVPENFTCLYWHKPDKGMYEGLKQAFDFILSLELHNKTITTYINADDILMPYTVKTVNNVFDIQGIHWLTGAGRVIGEDDKVLFENSLTFCSDDILNHLHDGRSGYFLQQEGTFWSLSLYHKTNGFNPALKLAGDYDLWQQFSNHEQIYTFERPLGSFRKNKGQKSENLEVYYNEIDSSNYLNPTDSSNKISKNRSQNGRGNGFLVASENPHSISQVSTIWGHKRISCIRARDPLFSYPVELKELIKSENQLHLYPQADSTHNSHVGSEVFSIIGNPEDFFWYVPIKESSVREDIDYFFEETSEGSAIIKMKIAGKDCKLNSKIIITIDGFERAINLNRSKNQNVVDTVIEIDLLVQLNGSRSKTISYSLYDCYFAFVSISNQAFSLPQDILDYGYLDTRFKGWPYLSNSLKLSYSDQYLDKLPSISVVVPTFNQGNTIRATLTSLYAQHYPKLQVIVLDGKSNDSTREVLKDFLGFISEIRSWKDSGQSAAIAEGIEMATGDIVTWLNTDDLYAPLTLFKVAEAYIKGGNPDILAGNCYAFRDENFKWIHSCQIWNKTLDPSQILDVKNYWLRGKYFHQPEVFFTRSAIKKVEEYCNESFINNDLYYSMDYDIWAKMAISGCSIQKINTVTAMYRLTEEQKTSSVDNYLPELLAHSKALSEKYNIDSNLCVSENNSAITSWGQFKVLLFNDVGFFGGAGIAHERIATSLGLYGVDVKCIAVSDTWIDEKHMIDLSILKRKLDEIKPNLVICGNIHGIKNDHLEILKLLSSHCPCWFVVHDFWITNGSDPYPSLDWQHPLADLLPAFQDWISTINDIENLYLIPNSAYCKQILSKCKFEQIIDSSFHLSLKNLQTDSNSGPMERIARVSGSEKLVIALGSVGLLEERKGISILLDALKIIPKRVLCNLRLESYGFNSLDEISQYCDYVHHGFVSQNQVQEILKTADIYINTSRIETFGQTTLESLDYGLICLSNENGGSSEMIKNGSNSRSFEMNSESLAHALSELHDSIMTQDISLDCKNKLARSLSVSSFSSQSQGYALLNAIVKSGQFNYPVGGQKVNTIDPNQLDLSLELL